MHTFVYALEFRGHPTVRPGTPFWSIFLRYTVVGYAITLVISFYVLWTFGRIDDTAIEHVVMSVAVLSFPRRDRCRRRAPRDLIP